MKKLIASIAIALSLATVFPSFSAAAAELSEYSAKALSNANGNTLDYTEKYTPNAYLSPSDLLAMLITDDTVSDVEKCYVDDYFEQYLTYSAVLPASLVELTVSGQSVEVSAKAHRYTDKNGKTVTYIPIYATVGSEKVYLKKNGEVYGATLTAASDKYVNVYYNGSLEIPVAVANKLINFTYNEATDAIERHGKLLEYGEALNEYKRYLEALEKYEADLEEYEAYLSANSLYEKALDEYNKNLKELEEYAKKKAAYDEYVSAHQKYLADKEKYESDYLLYQSKDKEYKKYFSNITEIRKTMIAIESLFVYPSETLPLYDALQNEELVVMFEKYKSVLVSSLGVSEKDIEYLRKYSDELNELLRGYASARAVSEEAAFVYYKQNYARISELFNNVYDKFTAVINSTVFNFMCGWIELEYGKDLGEYRKWRVKNVLIHIYLVARCLDDSRTVDEKWSFYLDNGDPHEYEFHDLLEPHLILTDENRSDPKDLTWIVPVDKPVAPTLPKAPQKVDEPVKPVEILKPTEPKKVDKPTEPKKVDEPTAPENVDSDFLLRTENIVKLVDSKDAPLSYRTPFAKAPTVNTEIKISKAISADGKATASVYLPDSDEPYVIDDLSKLPTVSKTYSDERSTYTFTDWSLSPTEMIALPKTLSGSIDVYPLYSVKPRVYKITFSVNGVETTKEYEVGAFPSADGIDLSMPSDEKYDYTFNGWDYALRPVRSDFKYTAVEYKKTERTFTVTFNYGENTQTKTYTYGSVVDRFPTVDETYILGEVLYTFVKWDKEPQPITADTVYTAIYESVTLVHSDSDDLTLTDGVSEFAVSGSGTSFEISELMKLAKTSGKSIRIDFSEYGVSLLIGNGAVLKLIEKGANKVVLKSSEENGIAIGFVDGSGSSVSAPDDGMRLRIFHEYSDTTGLTVRETYSSGLYRENIPYEFTEEYCDIVIKADAYYAFIKEYTLTVESGENGVVFSDSDTLRAGEKIELSIKPNSEYKVKSITFTNESTGETVVYDSADGLVMPDGNVKIRVEFEKIYYTVTFSYHGNKETATYSFGEMPKAPDIPKEFVENGLKYVFAGWSSKISFVEGDVEYTAKYFTTEYPKETETSQSAIGAIYGNYVEEPLTVLSIIVVLMVGVLVFIIVKKIYDSKKKR